MRSDLTELVRSTATLVSGQELQVKELQSRMLPDLTKLVGSTATLVKGQKPQVERLQLDQVIDSATSLVTGQENQVEELWQANVHLGSLVQAIQPQRPRVLWFNSPAARKRFPSRIPTPGGRPGPVRQLSTDSGFEGRLSNPVPSTLTCRQ